MTTVKTDLGTTRESARRLRYEPGGSIAATNTQEAIEELENETVSGPASSTDNAVARWDGTNGATLQNSQILISDTGVMTGGEWQGGPVAAPYGGTGQLVYAIGDLLYASSTTALSKLAAGTSGYALIAGATPAWTGFLQSGTGAVTRTWQDKARDIVHAADWGVSASASAAANTTALNAFFLHVRNNQLHGILPPGGIQHTGLIIAGNGNSFSISGSGGSARVTRLINTSTTSDDLTLDCTSFGMNTVYIGNLTFDSTSTKTAGYAIRQTGDQPIASESIIENLFLSTKTFGGIRLRGASNLWMQGIVIHNVGAGAKGVWLDGGATHGIGVVGSDIRILNGVGPTSTGFYFGDVTGGLFDHVEVQGGVGMMGVGIHLAGPNIVNTYFVNSYTDACYQPLVIDDCEDVRFTNCLLANSISGFHCVTINNGDGITFDNCEEYGGLRNGFRVASGVTNLKIVNCLIARNGAESIGTYAGIHIENGTNYFHICNNTFHIEGTANTHSYDIHVVGTTHDAYFITGNDVSRCASGVGINDEGTSGINKIVAWNTKAGINNAPHGHYIGTQPILFGGLTSGRVTLTTQAVAGTPTATFGTGSGTLVVSATSPLVANATTGNMTITGLAGGVLAGSTPAFTTTPTLGASGTLGSLTFGNATSGLLTLQPITGALGTVTLSMPAATDQLVARATTDTLTNKTISGASNTLSGPVNGVTDGSAAAAGKIGEYVEVVVASGSAVALTTGTPANMTAGFSLTAGDWDVTVTAYFNLGATTNITRLLTSLSINTESVNVAAGFFADWEQAAAVPGGNQISQIVANQRYSLTGTTTIYPVIFAAFTVSTCAVWGKISARRVR